MKDEWQTSLQGGLSCLLGVMVGRICLLMLCLCAMLLVDASHLLQSY